MGSSWRRSEVLMPSLKTAGENNAPLGTFALKKNLRNKTAVVGSFIFAFFTDHDFAKEKRKIIVTRVGICFLCCGKVMR